MIQKNSESRPLPIEALPTEHLLRLHERLFAPLDPRGRQRLLDAAARSGWDARWHGMDALGALAA